MPNCEAQKKEVSKREIRKLSKIYLYRKQKAFPESFLKSMKGDSLLMYTAFHYPGSGLFFVDTKVDFNHFDRALIINKKSRVRNIALASATLGVASFFITKEISKANPADAFIAPGTDPRVNRPLNSGNVEGVLAGVIGAGLGIIIGEFFFKKEINFNHDRKKAKEEIRKYLKRQ